MLPSGESGGLDDVAVVIVTYNSAGDVARCLRHLPIEELGAVVVVDNASTDGTIAAVESVAPTVHMVASRENLGFGAGCNLGARVGLDLGCRVAVFVNPDAAIDGDGLRELRRFLAANPRAAVAGPALAGLHGPLSPGGDAPTFRTELRFVLPRRFEAAAPDRRIPPLPDGRPREVGYVEGACMAVDLDAFEEVGGFDPTYFLFFEEADLAERLRRRNRTLHVVPAVTALHDVGTARAAVPHAARDRYYESTTIFLAKWRGSRAALGFVVVALVSWIYEAAAGSLSLAEVTAYLRASLRGFRLAVSSRQTRS